MILQAIVTRYHGPTNVRGGRIKATACAGSIIVSYDHALDNEANHAAAAKAFADKMGWGGKWYGGGLPDERGNVYVLAHETYLGPVTPAFTAEPKAR